LHGFLAWMYASALGHFMRESGPWTYAIVNLGHILGIGALFGAVLIIDLRLLGVWRRTPLSVLTHVAVPVAAGGFGVATLSGIGLLAANATEYVGNPFFYVKFPAIAIGLVNAFVVSVSPAWQASGTRELTSMERRQLALMGATSLTCWLTAIAAGRMVGYW
jgi:hypothetical protein